MLNYVQNNIQMYILLRYGHTEHHNKSIRRQFAFYFRPLSGLISSRSINLLNAELNLICHLLVLLGAHHIFHVSRIRVNKTKKKKILIIVVEEIRFVDGLE